MDPDLAKLLGTGGVAGALLALIYWVGMRLVRAIDAIGAKLDTHTITDVQHSTNVVIAITRIDEKLDAVLEERDRTPIEGIPRAGYYSTRPSTKPGK